MKKIEKIPTNEDDIFQAFHRLADKVNELVDAVNEMCFGKQKEEPRKGSGITGDDKSINWRGNFVSKGNSGLTNVDSKPSLAERLQNAHRISQGNPYGTIADEAKKAFEEVVKEAYWAEPPSKRLSNESRDELIERIRGM